MLENNIINFDNILSIDNQQKIYKLRSLNRGIIQKAKDKIFNLTYGNEMSISTWVQNCSDLKTQNYIMDKVGSKFVVGGGFATIGNTFRKVNFLRNNLDYSEQSSVKR